MTTITLTPMSAGPPAPYVDVLVDDIDVAAVTVTLWRTVAGRAMKVRGLVNVAASGAVTTRDFEAPFDRSVIYRVEHFDSNGDRIGYSLDESTTLAGLAQDEAWFHNPLDPSTAVKVELLGQRDRQLTRPVDFEQYRIPSRSVGVSIFSGARHGLENVVLDCATLTAEDELKFDALFGGYDDDTIAIVCVRTLPNTRLPGTLFAVVGSPSKRPLDGAAMGEQLWWGIVGNETAPPPEAIIVALLDYADFTAFYSDYAAFTAAYADYTEATRDYSIAGSA